MTSSNFGIGIYILFILETLAMTAYMGGLGIYNSPIAFLVISLIMAVAAIWHGAALAPDADTAPNELDTKNSIGTYKRDWTSLFYLSNIFLVLIWYNSSRMHEIPLDLRYSDVFPQLLSAARWFMQGEYAYQMVKLSTYEMNNTYLPMQWLPFCISEYFGTDPRWIPLLSWAIAMLALVYTLKTHFLKTMYGWKRQILVLIGLTLPAWAVYFFICYNTTDYLLTIELLPASYYVWLCIGLLSGSTLTIGLALGSCLLSRFSILFFIPFLLYYIAHTYNRQKMWTVIGITVAFIFCVFVLPFMSQDPNLPSKIVSNYTNGALSEWQGQEGQAAGSEPRQIARGLGMAIFFKKAFEPNLIYGIEWLKRTEIVLCLLTTLFMYLLYRRYAQHIRNQQWILLGGIKLYFVCFYHFILIPYPYLFLMPLTISAIIVLKIATEINQPKTLA